MVFGLSSGIPPKRDHQRSSAIGEEFSTFDAKEKRTVGAANIAD
jgi:hypothetical protein